MIKNSRYVTKNTLWNAEQQVSVAVAGIGPQRTMFDFVLYDFIIFSYTSNDNATFYESN